MLGFTTESIKNCLAFQMILNIFFQLVMDKAYAPLETIAIGIQVTISLMLMAHFMKMPLWPLVKEDKK